MIYLSAIVLLLLIFLAVLLLFSFRKTTRARTRQDDIDYSRIMNSGPVSDCPLCGEPLQKGERVHSLLFPGGKEDSIMHIYGCPYCYAEHPRRNPAPLKKRNCPSCRSPLDPGDYVYARVYKKPYKTHVSIIGCTRCRGIRP